MVKTLAILIAAASGVLLGQVKTTVPDVVAGARPAIVERIKIHGKALEGNLEGNVVDRDAFVFLPPSYRQNRTRRYPVVYAWHGYSIGAEQWTKEIHVPRTIEGAFANRAIAIDVGDQDGLRGDAGKLHDALDRYGIAHTFEVYPGTHTSDVAVRFQEHVLPFFSRTLSFQPARR